MSESCVARRPVDAVLGQALDAAIRPRRGARGRARGPATRSPGEGPKGSGGGHGEERVDSDRPMSCTHSVESFTGNSTETRRPTVRGGAPRVDRGAAGSRVRANASPPRLVLGSATTGRRRRALLRVASTVVDRPSSRSDLVSRPAAPIRCFEVRAPWDEARSPSGGNGRLREPEGLVKCAWPQVLDADDGNGAVAHLATIPRGKGGEGSGSGYPRDSIFQPSSVFTSRTCAFSAREQADSLGTRSRCPRGRSWPGRR